MYYVVFAIWYMNLLQLHSMHFGPLTSRVWSQCIGYFICEEFKHLKSGSFSTYNQF